MKWKFILYIIGILLILWIAAMVLLPPLHQYLALKKDLDDLEKENDHLKQKIFSLQQEEERIKNDTFYLEYIIRRDLKMMKPEERVYRVK
ncbi:MAG: septum formation initiator family protein [Caldiserica bacterium]|nr:septum formation initiator family protein [Caldisericota bacterium]